MLACMKRCGIKSHSFSRVGASLKTFTTCIVLNATVLFLLLRSCNTFKQSCTLSLPNQWCSLFLRFWTWLTVPLCSWAISRGQNLKKHGVLGASCLIRQKKNCCVALNAISEKLGRSVRIFFFYIFFSFFLFFSLRYPNVHNFGAFSTIFLKIHTKKQHLNKIRCFLNYIFFLNFNFWVGSNTTCFSLA